MPTFSVLAGEPRTQELEQPTRDCSPTAPLQATRHAADQDVGKG